MTRPWLRPLARVLSLMSRYPSWRRPRAGSGFSGWHRPMVDVLEDRTLPALITWINPAGGSWGTAANWDLNRLPTFADDVVIPDLPGNQTITFSVSGTTTVKSITTAETISVNSNTLVNAGNLDGSGRVTVAGGTFTLSGSNWVNTSTISITSGTLNLGGTFTPANLGTITRTGGTAGAVNVTGTLDNTGTTLLLDTANNGYGTWTLSSGGTLKGGTVATAGGAEFRLGSGTLDGVTLAAGSVAVSNSGAAVTVVNGLTVDGTLTLGSGSTNNLGLSFNGSQLLGGSGQIFLTGGQWLRMNQASMTLTIGPALTIESSSANTGLLGITGFQEVVNHGTLRGAGGFRLGNNATLETFVNAPSGRVEVVSGTFTLDPTTWTNQGTIAVAGGTLNLDGTFSTADLGTITRTGGTAGAVNITGTLDNTGTTLLLDTANNGYGTWTLSGGTLKGGTVVTAGGAEFRLTSGTLDGVTLAAGSVAVSNSGAAVTVVNGLTVDGTLTLGSGGALSFNGTQTLGGSGQVLTSGGDLQLNAANMTLTIAPTLTIQSSSASAGFTGYTGFQQVVNHGKLQGNGGFNISSHVENFINAPSGRIEVVSGTVTINPDA